MNTEMLPVNSENVTSDETEPLIGRKDRLSSIASIIIFSYIGVIIRLGLDFLGNNQTPLCAAFWPNFVGCFLMGFVVEQEIHLKQHSSSLYIGLTSGLCGSITTFPGLMYNSCLALYGTSSHYTYPFSNYFVVITSAFSSSFTGFILGRHLGVCIFPFSSTMIKKAPISNIEVRPWFFLILISISILLFVPLAVRLPLGHYTHFVYSVIFAPFGSLTRYLLSTTFNYNSNFPLGTLIANVTGSYIYFGIVAIQGSVHTLSPLVEQITISIIEGYCGCLTTVSTFIFELIRMGKGKYSYTYFIITLLPVQIVYIVLGYIFSFLCSPSS